MGRSNRSKMDKKRYRMRKEKNKKHSSSKSEFYYCTHCKILYTQVHIEFNSINLSTFNPESKKWMEALHQINKKEVKCDLCRQNITKSVVKIPHDVIDFYKIHMRKNLHNIIFSKSEVWDTKYVVGVLAAYMFDYIL